MTRWGQAEVSTHVSASKFFLLPALQVRSLGQQPTLGWGEGSREKAPGSNGQIDEGRQHLIGSNLGGDLIEKWGLIKNTKGFYRCDGNLCFLWKFWNLFIKRVQAPREPINSIYFNNFYDLDERPLKDPIARELIAFSGQQPQQTLPLLHTWPGSGNHLPHPGRPHTEKWPHSTWTLDNLNEVQKLPSFSKSVISAWYLFPTRISPLSASKVFCWGSYTSE